MGGGHEHGPKSVGDTMEKPTITYIFTFPDGRQESFELHLDTDPDGALQEFSGEPPEWTHLGVCQCDNCPLDPAAHPYCPLALKLVDPVTRFGEVLSYHEVEVKVITDERTIVQGTTAQSGISAMMGLLNATSGCPHTAYFRPMARFHLPFASEDETVYRAASMYLLGQYFRQHQGHAVGIDFDGLLDIYRNIETVNRAMANRLRTASREDGTVNALVLLDMFAKTLPVAIEDSLEELRPLFGAYL